MLISAIILVQLLIGESLAELYKPQTAISCSTLKSCPVEWPCCSPYGECGAGPVCVGSCNPRFSFRRDSCIPIPALVPESILEYIADPPEQPVTEPIKNLLLQKGFTHFTEYLITPDEAQARRSLEQVEYTYSGPVKLDNDTGDLLLTMPKRTTGSLIASTKSFLYGKSQVRLKSGRSRGVITSVVLISSVGDEIDFEFLGSELNAVQSNYFFRGELIYTHMKYINVSSLTWEEYHEYGFDWNEERVHWLVDGDIVRTLYKADTWDEGRMSFIYPETPMRLEVALWPGGAETNHPGTIEWAGGQIDWDNSTDIVESGQFTAKVNYMLAEPYENMYTSSMASCPSREKGITYGYVGPDDASLEWYCNLTPYVHGWNKSWLDTVSFDLGEAPTPIVRNVQRKHGELVSVVPERDFIQDTKRLYSSPNGAMHYKNKVNTTVDLDKKTSAGTKLSRNNPVHWFKMLAYSAVRRVPS